MKHFLIKYRFTNGTEEQWHQDIKDFIAALQNDADLKGRISYRCMKVRDDLAYYHLASAIDDQDDGQAGEASRRWLPADSPVQVSSSGQPRP